MRNSFSQCAAHLLLFCLFVYIICRFAIKVHFSFLLIYTVLWVVSVAINMASVILPREAGKFIVKHAKHVQVHRDGVKTTAKEVIMSQNYYFSPTCLCFLM